MCSLPSSFFFFYSSILHIIVCCISVKLSDWKVSDSGNVRTLKLIGLIVHVLKLVVSLKKYFLDRELGLGCRSIDED